jgi:hypothetical protein
VSSTEQLPGTQNQTEAFIFLIPHAPIRRTVTLVFACLLLVPAAVLAWVFAFRATDAMWTICGVIAVFLLGSAFFLRLSFPPRRSLARLEFRHNDIRFIPARVDQWLRDPVDVSIQPDAEEILIRRQYATHKVLIRRAGGQEYDTGIAMFTELSARDADELVNGISAVTGLPARIVNTHRTADGQLEDQPWKPRSAAAKWGTLGKLLLVTMGLWGGAIAGYLTASLTRIAIVGVALWLAQSLALMAYARVTDRSARFPWLYWVSTIFTFGASYAAVAVFVSYQVYPR